MKKLWFFIGLHSVEKYHQEENHKNIKQELLNSLKKNDDVEELRPNETAGKTNGPHEALIITDH